MAGPWETTLQPATNTWAIRHSNGGDVLAQLIEHQDEAILMAAAPELLAALQKAQEDLEVIATMAMDKQGHDRIELAAAGAYKEIRTVVAKAKGESSATEPSIKAKVRHMADVAQREGVPEDDDDMLDNHTRAYLADPYSHTDVAWGQELLARWVQHLNAAGVNYDTSDAPRKGGA